MKLLPHQVEGVRRILSHSSSFMCDDMGLGKTATVITAVLQRGAFPILVVCPAAIKENWKREFKTWGNVEAYVDTINAPICIINYERMEKVRYIIKDYGFKQVIFDESHLLKTEKAKRSIIAKEWARLIPFKVLITGTPMLNRPLELLNQLDILNRLDEVGGRDNFLNRFCGKRKGYGGYDYKGFSHLDHLEKLMDKIWIRRVKADLSHKLPKKNIIKVPICRLLQPPPSSLIEIERLDRVVVEVKLPLIYDFIDRLLATGEKVVVFVHHHKIGDALMARYPNASQIVGGQNKKERQANIDAFQLGDKQLIVCSLLASAVGLTLTSARLAVFLEYPWSPSLLSQAQDRIHRLSQTKECFIYYLYAKDSIDEYRLNTNKAKEIIISNVIK